MQKGFTLVEILAVLVLLAIVSTVSYLIVGNTISNSKNKLSDVQIDNIIEAAKSYYLKEGMTEENIDSSNSESCVNLSYLVDNGYIDNPEVKNLTNNEKLVASVKIKYSNNKYKYEYLEEACSICKFVDGEPNKEGAKYSCEVKPGTSYNFYVLSQNNDGTTNLIMDRNIYYDSSSDTSYEVNSTNTGFVAWQIKGANGEGPVTAMDYLYNATKDWNNVPNIEINYTDEGNTSGYGYGTIITTNGVTKITKQDGTTVNVLTDKEGYTNLKARMIYYREVTSLEESKEYLYDNLDSQGTVAPHGYWTLSTSSVNDTHAKHVYVGESIFGSDYVGNNGTYAIVGVRPVITVKL